MRPGRHLRMPTPPTHLKHTHNKIVTQARPRIRLANDMTGKLREDPIIQRLIHWATNQPAVRAMILTSSRTSPTAPVDLLSAYDVILAVDDVRPFHESRAWLEEF